MPCPPECPMRLQSPTLDMALLHFLAHRPWGARAHDFLQTLATPRPAYSTIQLHLQILRQAQIIERVGYGLYALHPMHGPVVLAIGQILEDLCAAGVVVRSAHGRYRLRDVSPSPQESPHV